MVRKNRSDEEFELDYLAYIYSLPKVEISVANCFNDDIIGYPVPFWENINGEQRLVNRAACEIFMRNTPTGTCIPVFINCTND